MTDSQSSQVRWAFWQWKHARFAFFFLGPSRVRVGCEVDSAESLAASKVRLRLNWGFLCLSDAEEEEELESAEGAPEKIWWAATARPREPWS